MAVKKSKSKSKNSSNKDVSKVVDVEAVQGSCFEKILDQDPVVEFPLGEGPERPYAIIEPTEAVSELRVMCSKVERLLVLVLTAIAAFVRLRNLGWPNSVVFDEVHFGGFASKYIRNQFFFDVHPPLAKMLFAYVGQLAGFQGDFDFEKIGMEFPNSTPYVYMRLFSACAGVITVLLMYFTLRSSGIRIWVAFLTTLCFVVENSFVTISRYILLDAPLMLFIAAAVYSFKKYELYPSFSWNSYRYLLATGLGLGLAASSKWVGLFTIAWVGIICAIRLFFFVGDLSKPISNTFMIAVNKLVFLLGVPFILYATFFYVHFQTLTMDGGGSSFFSPAFRTSLVGNIIPKNVQSAVGIGSVVTLRHTGTTGGYLHSHTAHYETGSKQQQVTAYGNLDPNNRWIIELADRPGVSFDSFQNISDGTVIRLFHLETEIRLHSHDHKAPVSEYSDWQKEVSGYGYSGFPGDYNDDWIVEIDKSKSAPGEAQDFVKSIDTKFRLKHAASGCYLFSHNTKLPKWGFEQQEVSCAHAGQPFLTLWYIEDSVNPTLPEDTKRVSYITPGFWGKFFESQEKMWSINKGLTATHNYQSYPQDWPLLQRGISYWGEHRRQVYLFGNILVWWSVSLSFVFFAVIVIGEIFAWHLGYPILQDAHVINFHIQYAEYMLGFAVHYVPSFLMQRQMFLHHYLPAYYFGILAFAHVFDITVTYLLRCKRNVGYTIAIIFTAACIYLFYMYSPLAYGTEWTRDLCKKSQWLPTWDYDCNSFLESIEEYATIATTTATATATAVPETASA